MLLDGKLAASKIEQLIKARISELKGRPPKLGVILVGENPASQVYVKRKTIKCAEVGIETTMLLLDDTISQNELLKHIHSLNQDPEIDGILVQLPLPAHIDPILINEAISPSKDIDGFHPMNMGKLFLGQQGGFVPCTPLGILELLKQYNIPIKGKRAVILGRSAIVGKPMAALLLMEDATVTIAHSKTQNLSSITQEADLLVAAIGKPRFVTQEMVKPGACVIDVGINRLDGKLVGDVDFDAVCKKAGAITPVPGGVGPMTIAMLLSNTLKSRL